MGKLQRPVSMVQARGTMRPCMRSRPLSNLGGIRQSPKGVEAVKQSETNKIVLCGEGLSSNLGDGVIADCLEFLIQRLGSETEIVRLDLSGRIRQVNPAKPVSDQREKIKRLAAIKFPKLINLVRWAKKRSFTGFGQLVTSDTTMLVIGGGQLLMDNNWRFPLDLAALAFDAHRKKIPIAFHACGVGESWSWVGKALIRAIFARCDVRYVSVRDVESASRLKQLLKGIDSMHVEATIDPAVWASEVYGLNRSTNVKPSCALTVGLGIMSNLKIPAATAGGGKIYPRSELANFWVDLALSLRRKGFSVALFTNGAQEDEFFADEISEKLEKIAPHGSFWKRKTVVTEPCELARQIGDFDGIIAHRLHASIIAFSQGVPAVSLEWDSKVRSFSKAVGRSRWVISATELTSAYAADLVEEAIKTGVCQTSIENVKQSTLVATERLLQSAVDRE